MPSPRRLKVGDRVGRLTIAVLALTMTGCRRSSDAAQADPAPRLTLPVVDGAPRFDENDAIVVEVFRARTDATSEETRTWESNGWQIDLGGDGLYRAERGSLTRLSERLTQLAQTRAGTSSPYLSKRALLIRADAEAPFHIVRSIFEAAAVARLPRVFSAVRATRGGATGAVASPLPNDRSGQTLLVLAVTLSWDADRGLRRELGPTSRLIMPPTGDPILNPEKVVIPGGPEGDGRIDALLRDRYAEFRAVKLKGDYTHIDIEIHADGGLPWRDVVEFIHRAGLSGPWRIGFALF
jgi:hypothetical protein